MKTKFYPQSFMAKIRLILTLFITGISATSSAQTYPTGFNQAAVTSSLTAPTNMAFAPDGRIFICEQAGTLRVIKNGSLLVKPFITLTVNHSGERGLLGVAFDPKFATNNLVYLYYTLPDGSHNRIIRVKADGDTAKAAPVKTVLDLDPLSSATNHNGGSIKFGKDKKLYVAVGENANGANAQNLDTYLGKLLRINKDGTVPTGNPYTTGSEQKKRVWEYGLRNPFTFDVEKGTGRIFVDDVGESTWEEINDASTSNHNFGWPNAEGNSANPAYTNPVYVYSHTGTTDSTGCAITGGAFFTHITTNYPGVYKNSYFFMDLCGHWINRISLKTSPFKKYSFATTIGGNNVGLTTGPDGNLYFLSRDNGTLYKIIYTPTVASAEASLFADKPVNKPGRQLKEVLIYPSPANSTLTIDAGSFIANKAFVNIYDAKGLLVKNLRMTGTKTTVNTSSLTNGFYFIIINDGTNIKKMKVEVIH